MKDGPWTSQCQSTVDALFRAHPPFHPSSPSNLINLLGTPDRSGKGVQAIESRMVYIGGPGTYTPTHTDLCGSLGLNISVPTLDFTQGSSVWIIYPNGPSTTVLRKHFHALGIDVEQGTDEVTFDQIKRLRAATGLIPWVWRQKPGELVLIPPAAPHSVYNTDGITIKLAWSVMLFSSLRLSLVSELEVHRRYFMLLFTSSSPSLIVTLRAARPSTYRVEATLITLVLTRMDLLADCDVTFAGEQVDRLIIRG